MTSLTNVLASLLGACIGGVIVLIGAGFFIAVLRSFFQSEVTDTILFIAFILFAIFVCILVLLFPFVRI